MKPVVLITKVGSVFYTRELAARASKVGEQGETEGIINHLLERDDIQVVYFGQWRGEIPEKMKYVESHLEDLGDLSTAKHQEKCWAIDTKAVQEYEPVIFVQVAGYAATLSWIGNPRVAGVQAAGVRYVSPLLNILQSLKLPRIVVNNDPRSYPREGEMSMGWDYVLPRALLSQRTKEWSRIIHAKQYNVREVYAGAENWCEHIRLERPKTVPCTIVSHAHIKDGCKFKARDEAWANVLAPVEDVEELKDLGLRVYGKGWEHFSGYDSSYMLGSIRPNEVMEILAEAKTCPAVAAGDGFYTGKLRTCLAQDCLPLFYGRGAPHTFDPLEKYVPFSSEFRIVEPGDLLRVVDYFNEHERDRQWWVNYLWERSKPDWSLFDDCVNDVLAGRDMNTESWWQKYGGYRRA
jgi:hypothetical protein